MTQLPSRILSVKHPWAWLIVNGFKDIENRSWKTSFRGPVFIHAGKKIDHTAYEEVKIQFGHKMDLPDPDEFGKGGIVGATTIIDCLDYHPSSWYQDGHYTFVLQESRPLPFLPYKGKLGFFKFENERYLRWQETVNSLLILSTD